MDPMKAVRSVDWKVSRTAVLLVDPMVWTTAVETAHLTAERLAPHLVGNLDAQKAAKLEAWTADPTAVRTADCWVPQWGFWRAGSWVAKMAAQTAA